MTPSEYNSPGTPALYGPGRFQKAMIIYNPESGQGLGLSLIFKALLGIKRVCLPKCEARAPESSVRPIQAILREYGIEAEVALTTHPGSGVELARQSVEAGCDVVVVVGGDGTINEVVNGLAGSETVLGVIPAGTANIFSLQMQLPTDVRAACRVIAEGSIRRIDLGRARDRYFLCMAGVGFDAYVIKKTDSRLKRLTGAVAYAWVAVRRFFSYPFRTIVLRVDDQPALRRGYLLIVGNGKYYGGDMMIMPSADMADGYLDVCLFKRKQWWNLIGYLWGLRRGALERYIDVDYFKCRKLHVWEKGHHYVHVDAEYLCRTPVTISVEPGALRVIV